MEESMLTPMTIQDRFIPRRDQQSNTFSKRLQVPQTNFRGVEVKENHITVEQLFCKKVVQTQKHVLNFHSHDRGDHELPKLRTRRLIPKTPFKVLDAPNLKDDYYLNLLSWNDKNSLAVALGDSVYTWNGNTGKVNKFCSHDSQVTSICFSKDSQSIAIGDSSGICQIWDTNKSVKVNKLKNHCNRISSSAWSSTLLATGSRDKALACWDHRQRDLVFRATGFHNHQICGLKWSNDQNKLASGGNDNKLLIWNVGDRQPCHKFTNHTAAVKAIAWSPNSSNILASGGGSADKCIRFWNLQSDSQTDYIDTGSQVCNLVFSKNTSQLVSTHGYSQNEIVCWKYPSLEKSAVLLGHSSRVLYLAMSPCGQTIVTGAGDQTLRFWRLFPSAKEQSGPEGDLKELCLR